MKNLFAIIFLGSAFVIHAHAGGPYMKESVQNIIKLTSSGKTVKPIFNESFKVVGIGLMKGQKLEKHDTPTPAFLIVQEGEVEFSIAGEKFKMKAGDFYKIPANELHEIEAFKNSWLLLAK